MDPNNQQNSSNQFVPMGFGDAQATPGPANPQPINPENNITTNNIPTPPNFNPIEQQTTINNTQMQATANPYLASQAPTPQQMPQSPVMSQNMPQPMVNQQQSVPGQQVATAKPPVNPNSTQNLLEIAEIRDGIVIMKDGSFRSVIMVKSINFDLMSPQERDAVEFSYQGFLNSLYFPVQIFIRSQKVDLREYIEKLDKIRTEHENMLLAMLMDDYINYIDMLAAQTNIMDKHFYVVVPYFPITEDPNIKPLASSKSMFDGIFNMFSTAKTHVVIDETKLEAAKTELRNRVQAVLAGLLQCGIQGLPLDTQELIELYYDSYNPDTATRQQLKNFNDLTAPVVTKGEGIAPQPNLEREMQ